MGKIQITIAKYVSSLLRSTLGYYRDMLDQTDCQDNLNQSYRLMLLLIDLNKCDMLGNGGGTVVPDDVLTDLGHLIRYLRHTWSNEQSADVSSVHRMHYIQLLQLLGRIIKAKQTVRKYDPTEFTSASFQVLSSAQSPLDSNSSADANKSVWEHELEVAVYDYPLQQLHGELYKIIRNIVKVSFSVVNFILRRLTGCLYFQID